MQICEIRCDLCKKDILSDLKQESNNDDNMSLADFLRTIVHNVLL